LNYRNWKVFDNQNPSSLGLTNKQIKFLKKELKNSKKKNIIVCIHCPAFFSEKKLNPTKLSCFAYNLMRLKHGLISDTFLQNNWNFIKTMLESDKNITVVSSHTHFAKEFIADKKTLILQESNFKELNKEFNNSNKIKFITTLALSKINKYNNKIGYLKISNKYEEIVTGKY
jgi:hypothetical protein